jgi:hypothetical protein
MSARRQTANGPKAPRILSLGVVGNSDRSAQDGQLNHLMALILTDILPE